MPNTPPFCSPPRIAKQPKLCWERDEAAVQLLPGHLAAATQADEAAAGCEARADQLAADAEVADGKLSLPSEVTEAGAAEAVERAREVGVSAVLLHDQDALETFANPSQEALDLPADSGTM